MLPIVLTPIVGLVAVLVGKAFAALPANQRPVLLDIVKKSVNATEQLVSSELSDPGKKQAALKLAQEQLDHAGLKVPTAVLGTLVEDAVFTLKKMPPVLPAEAIRSL